MMKSTILAFTAALALSTTPAMAGNTTSNSLTTNTLTANAFEAGNTVLANAFESGNTVVANGLKTNNTEAANAAASTDVHLIGAKGAPVATGTAIVLRLVAVEPAPR